MERFEIQPVLASGLAEAASFVHRQSKNLDADSIASPSAGAGVGTVPEAHLEARLRWLLLENPVAAEDSPIGFCARDGLGIMRGVTLCFPGAFWEADRRVLGLCSGSFFVEPEARMLGFYLFKKYLSARTYSFFYSTTCNAASARIWEKLGGWVVSNVEPEHILPLRLDTLLPALLEERISIGTASAIARVGGRCGNPILRLFNSRSQDLSVQASRDWPKLSELFHRHRPKEWITTDRTAEYLQWRYERNSDPYPCGVHLFRDKRGNEGWFALGNMARGRRGRIRGAVLLDAVWPRERMSFREILPAVAQLALPGSDLISFRARPGLGAGGSGGWFIRRRRTGPSVFAISRGHDSRALATSLDLVPADGDSALPVSFPAGCGSANFEKRLVAQVSPPVGHVQPFAH
jgi:hypothetical protein